MQRGLVLLSGPVSANDRKDAGEPGSILPRIFRGRASQPSGITR
jgi:hypothetical protein